MIYIERQVDNALKKGSTELDISCRRGGRNRFTDLPEAIRRMKDNITSLNIAGHNISTFPAWMTEFTNLRKINVIGNPIKIPDWIPELVIDLEILKDHRSINLGRVVGFAVNSNEGLTKVNQLFNLTELWIRVPELRAVPNEIYQIKQLKLLSIEGTKISKIDQEIRNLNLLDTLLLNNNRFYDFPKEILYLHQLKRLNLSKNNIKFIPTEIMELDSLKSLSLDGNLIEELPLSIGELQNLEQLILMNNHLSDLPITFKALNKLQILMLSNNNLSHLPNAIYKLTNLEILSLDNMKIFEGNKGGYKNHINKVQPDIFHLKKLKSFSMMGNKIQDPPITSKLDVKQKMLWYVFTPNIDLKQSEPVFISYSWEDESIKFVDLLQKKLETLGIKVERDKSSIGYTESIRTFMNALTKGRYIVVIISSKYLESENCMHELTESSSHGYFRQRIFPIIISGSIFNTEHRIDLIKFWENKYTTLENKLKNVNLENAKTINDRLIEISNIKRKIDSTLDILQDMNAMTAADHISDDFKTIIERIKQRSLNNAIQAFLGKTQ